MPRAVIVDMKSAIDSREYPTIVLWNRLEGRPRTDNFERAFKAEIRDALWMISRQWQMGEFQGDDAASPISAKIHLSQTQLDKYNPGDSDENPDEAFNHNELPLEAKVERRPLPLHLNGVKSSLDLRLLMGRQWLKMLRPFVADNPELIEAFKEKFRFELPSEKDEGAEYIYAHLDVWQQYTAVSGRAMDGGALLEFLRVPNKLSDAFPNVQGPNPETNLDILGGDFLNWVSKLFLEPEDPNRDAWRSSKLEYSFSVSAPGDNETTLYRAEEYASGRLDWYNFSIQEKSNSLDKNINKPITKTIMPSQLTFSGMPNTRWWEFEDGNIYFGDIKPNSTELAKLLLIEFGLVYANDWFLFPMELEAGSILNVEGIVVTNVFGERTWIKPSGQESERDWEKWGVFGINRKGFHDEIPQDSLFLFPTVPKIQESKPTEEVFLQRDEMLDMVWGIENRIMLPSGFSKFGNEAARETRHYHEYCKRNENDSESAPTAPVRYQSINSVPENWIPFIPVHVHNNNREVQQRKTAMPRIIKCVEEITRVRPRTILLQDGLNSENKKPYYIHEEEVPRSGIQVTHSFQRTRWYGGKVVNWFGVRKRVGCGEVSSGLLFDDLVNTSQTNMVLLDPMGLAANFVAKKD